MIHAIARCSDVLGGVLCVATVSDAVAALWINAAVAAVLASIAFVIADMLHRDSRRTASCASR